MCDRAPPHEPMDCPGRLGSVRWSVSNHVRFWRTAKHRGASPPWFSDDPVGVRLHQNSVDVQFLNQVLTASLREDDRVTVR